MRTVKTLGIIPSNDAVPVEVDRDVFERTRRWKLNTPMGELIIEPIGRPLQEGEVLLTDTGEKIVLIQKDEPVLIFSYDSISSFILGYKLGNLHLPVMVDGNRALVPKRFPDEFYRRVLEGLTFIEGRAKFKPNVNKVEV